MRRASLAWLERAAVHAGLAGAALGTAEAIWLIATAGGPPLLFLCAAGLGALGGALVGGGLYAIALCAGRPRWMQGYLSDLAAWGPRRVAALTHLICQVRSG